MSTSETVTFEKGLCPCGDGRIVQRVTTQDNPWSTADISYSIECQKCCSDWRLEATSPVIVLRSSETEYLAALPLQHAAFHELSTASEQIISNYFTNLAVKNKKSEHAELQRLGLTSMNYRQYLAHRNVGGTAASASHGLRNTAWLLSQAATVSRYDEIVELIDRYERARRATTTAANLIIRRKVA